MATFKEVGNNSSFSFCIKPPIPIDITKLNYSEVPTNDIICDAVTVAVLADSL